METFELKQALLKQRCTTCNEEFEPSDNLKSCPVDGTMLSPIFDDPFIGKVIEGKYEIIERIATGSKAKIYKAKHLHLDKFVALKVLQIGISVTQSQVARFQKEAQVAVRLVHPNIVRVYDYGTHPQPYIAMEYVEGNTISALIKQSGPLPPANALALFLDIANAMCAAHTAGLVHRDLKPSNVIVDSQSGEGKVLDFGLVKDFVDDAHYTKTGDIVGSPSYMSPEQWKGLPLDGRSDIYSFGCLIYESLTGTSPFAASNPVECMYKHLEAKPPKLSHASRNEKFPKWFDVIIGNCLIKDRDKRYHSMDDLRRDLLAVQGGNGRRVKSLSGTRSIAWIIGGWVGVQVLLFLLCFLAISYQGWAKPAWDRDLQQGIDAQELHDVQRSITLLLQAENAAKAAHAPPAGFQEIYTYLGRAHSIDRDNAKAREYLLRAVECSNQHGEDVHKSFCHQLLSTADFELQDYQPALETGKIALDVAARQSDNTYRLSRCHLCVADALWGLKRYREAAEEYEQTRKLYLKKLLPMKDRTGNPFYDSLLKFVTDNMIPPGDENNPLVVEIDSKLSDCYQKLNRDDDAIKVYGRGLRIASFVTPDRLPTLVEDFVPLFGIKLSSESIDEIAQEQRWPPYLISLLKGYVYKKQDKPSDAVIAFDQSIKSAPDALGLRSWLHFEKADSLEQQGQFSLAIEEFENCLTLLRKNGGQLPGWEEFFARAYDNKGYCQQCLGLYADAVNSYRQALSIDNSDTYPHRYLGECLLRAKRYDQAIRELKIAIRIDPKYTCGYHYIAECLDYLKRYDEAAKEWTKAIETGPKNHQTLESYRAVTYLAMGNFKAAAADGANYLRMQGWDKKRSSSVAIRLILAYRLDHNWVAANKILLVCNQKNLRKTWPYPVIGYLAGQITADNLKQSCQNDIDKLTEAFTYVGLDLFAKNKKDEAKHYFQWVVDHGNKNFIEYKLSTAFLDRMIVGTK